MFEMFKSTTLGVNHDGIEIREISSMGQILDSICYKFGDEQITGFKYVSGREVKPSLSKRMKMRRDIQRKIFDYHDYGEFNNSDEGVMNGFFGFREQPLALRASPW